MPRCHAALLLLLIAGSACAQPEPRGGTLVGEEKRTRDEMNVASRLAADKRYDDAVRRFQQILAEAGDSLVSLAPEQPRRAVPARWLVHQRIAALPPEARKVFRAAVEDTARRWLEQGTATRDVRLLEQVVAEAFCSASAEKALHLLGDLAFERGEFEIAEHYWRMLARYPSEVATNRAPPAFALLYPDPSGGGASAQAKLVLALIFRGEKTTATAELDQFRKLHPDASGELAGRTGKYADTLQAMLNADTRLAPAAAPIDTGWTTFAGDAGRNRVVPNSVLPYWPDVPSWTAALPGDPKAKPHRDSDPPLGTGASARSLAFHPVIAGGHVFIADAARVFAYELSTGRLAAEYDHRKNAGLPESLDLRVPSRSDAAYTLTVAGDRLYARFGVQPVKTPDATAKPKDQESVIACLAIRSDGGSLKLELRWQLRARALDVGPTTMFEGAPLVRDGRLYVARIRFEGRQTIAAVECYDADGADGRSEPPVRRWRQELWSVEAGGDPPRQRHDLLTVAGPNVVYCTHSGAIVALDAATGRRAWAYRYPTASRVPDLVLPRDLCPCLYADGRIFAAPADSDRILCLDARSGELVWEESANVVQLLGASNGRLIATLGNAPQGVRAFHAANGKVLWTKPDDGDLATFGRGFVSDRFVFWPTRYGLRVLRQDDGEAADARSSAAPWGHLALGEGHLIVTTPTEVWGFVPPRTEVGRWRRETAERPDDAEAVYRLALAEADAGEIDPAMADFRRAAALAGDQRLNGWRLTELAEHRRFELLLAKAERLWKTEEKDAARSVLREASSAPYPVPDRVRAWTLRRLAGDNATPGQSDAPELNRLWITRPDGRPQRADEFLGGVEPKGAPSEKPADGPPGAKRAPDIPIPFRISKSIELAPFREWPLSPFRDAATGEEGPPADAEGRVIFGGPRRAVCRSLDTGQRVWATELAHEATECGFVGDSVIIVGPDGISRLNRINGKLIWQFLPPDPIPMPSAFPEVPFRRLEPFPIREQFSAFRLTASRLYFRHGRQKLLALDVETSRALWQFRAPGISEHYLAAPEHLLLQSTTSELLALSAADGRLMYRRPAAVPWPQPPLLIDAARAVYTDGPRLHAIELDTATELWSYAPAGSPSLTGAASQFRRDRDYLVFIVERNYGYELERVQLSDGKPDLRPQFLGRDRADISRAVLTPEIYAIPAGDSITALAPTSGERRWEFKLPRVGDEPWRVRATRSALLLHPDEAIAHSAPARDLAGLPTLDDLQSAAHARFYRWSKRSFLLVAVSPFDGRKLHDRAFAAEGPRVALLLGERPALILGGRMELLR